MMRRLLSIGILVVCIMMSGLTTDAKSTTTRKSKSSSAKTGNSVTKQIPIDFGFDNFVEYDKSCDCYYAKSVKAQTLKEMGFKFLKKGTTYVLTGTGPDTFEKVASYTYEYKGIKVTLNQYGKGVDIVFPNKETLGQFVYVSMRGLPLQISDTGRYYLEGMAAFSEHGLKIIFDFDP